MNDRKIKNLIVKISITASLITVLMVILAPFIFGHLSPDKFQRIWLAIIIVTVFLCICMILLISVIGMPSKKQTADKINCHFPNCAEYEKHIFHELGHLRYKSLKRIQLSESDVVTIFVKPFGWGELRVFTLIKLSQLTSDAVMQVDDMFRSVLVAYYKGRISTDTIHEIRVFCVDFKTPFFQEFMDKGISQGFKHLKFMAGISFDNQEVSIAKKRDGLLAIVPYRKMQKIFSNLMDGLE